MEQILPFFAFICLVLVILVLAISRSARNFHTTSRIWRNAQRASWNLVEFLQIKSSKWKHREYYRFVEESVRSFTHRFIGRFDMAILHWEEAPILDLMIEYKFPTKILPERVRAEDMFQAGLYSLALQESGVSCLNTRLLIVYCLQDTANRCLQQKNERACWSCNESRIFAKRYNPHEVKKQLRKLDEVWYGKRTPQANPDEDKCRACPFSKNNACNFSAI